MQQLMELDKCRQVPKSTLPQELTAIYTPLVLAVRREKLAGYPDPAFSNYILKGISEGFRIGYNFGTKPLGSCSCNLLSAKQNPSVVDEYLSTELALGRIVECSDNIENIHFSPFRIIPKKNKPGKWRLIVDLSAPEGSSVNDAISKEWCSLSYVSIDDMVECILQKGRGATLAKMDVKHAYRNIPVHPEDCALLGMKWQGRAFADKVLPFGLRSAPITFTNHLHQSSSPHLQMPYCG